MKTPIASHFYELRRRLIYTLVVLGIAGGLCFYFAREILTFLAEPLMDALGQSQLEAGKAQVNSQGGGGLVWTSVLEVFAVHLKLALVAGLVVSFPFTVYQGWLFVEPALYRGEKPPVRRFLWLVIPLFWSGMAFCYYVVLPQAYGFFVGFSGGVMALPKASEYFGLVLQLLFAFGFVFLLPVGLLLLGQVGLVDRAVLKQKRKYAVVVAFLVAAILTPPDIASQVLLALPILLLYELSIVLMGETKKPTKKKTKEANKKTK